jgi:hypothetical protein
VVLHSCNNGLLKILVQRNRLDKSAMALVSLQLRSSACGETPSCWIYIDFLVASGVAAAASFFDFDIHH